jgi:cob(I)alamin adenosyltransferase
MKKLQLLTVAMLTATIGYETLSAKDYNKTSMMSESSENQSTPESRLLAKAIELRKQHDAGKLSLHRLHEKMDELLVSFKKEIKNAGRKFTAQDQNFFEFCKHKPTKRLQARMNSMKKSPKTKNVAPQSSDAAKMDLLEQAIVLRKGHEMNDNPTLHQLHKKMDELLVSFKEAIKNSGREFTSQDQDFFEFCKHKSVKRLETRMKSMRK